MVKQLRTRIQKTAMSKIMVTKNALILGTTVLLNGSNVIFDI